MELTRLEQIVAGADLTPLTRKEASFKKAIKRGIEEPKSGGSGGGALIVGTTLDIEQSTITLDTTAGEILEVVENSVVEAIIKTEGLNAILYLTSYYQEEAGITMTFYSNSDAIEYTFLAETVDDYPIAAME